MLFGDRLILPVSLVYFLAFSTVNLLEVLLFKDVLLILSGAVTVILLLFFSSAVPGAVSSRCLCLIHPQIIQFLITVIAPEKLSF